MTWQEFAMARQLLVEEKVGALVREAKRSEDRIASRNKAVMSKSRR